MRYTMMVLLVVGCVDFERSEPPMPIDPVDGVPYIAQQGEQDQGRHLLGALADAFVVPNGTQFLSTKTESFPAMYTLSASNGALVVTNTMTGAPVSLKTILPLTIKTSPSAAGDNVRIVKPASSPTPLLEFTDSAGSHTYCDGGGGWKVFSGYWEINGHHQAANALTFTCDDGVITKCARWGYQPNIPGNGTNKDPWTVHQACTRMAMADYCGDGITHTFEETSILIRDKDFPNAQPNIGTSPLSHPPADLAPPDRYWFEAAWNGGGAMCLGRERWKSLELDGHCPGTLPDPRVRSSAKYCDEMTPDDLKSAVIFNSSRTGQIYLNRWSNPSNGDQVATVRGTYHQKVPHDVPPIDAPFPGYTHFEETMGLLMRNPPHSLTKGVDLYEVDHEVHTTSSGLDHVLELGSAGTESSSFEGYVYSATGTGHGRLELKRWSRGGDTVAAVAQPPGPYIEQPPIIGLIDPP